MLVLTRKIGETFVVGDDITVTVVDIPGTNTNPPVTNTGALENTMNLPLSGTLRARAGFAQDRWLLYATAGVIYGEFDKDSTFSTSAGTVSPCCPNPLCSTTS